ncbi:unnamed protein product [Ostreobium quekettii]|uniref:ARC6 IMS domain-containing protein n=1 Tax=Ostreobium quekettii TaxID=121088 RepID=A0A8S1J1R4_9CHLO|nr:unnamed protein product [Ostreobium quekettii]|eukprot:evm.model.scf_618.4 EVM.evm.TU.scf_618.4   scf_618:26597-33634(+)
MIPVRSPSGGELPDGSNPRHPRHPRGLPRLRIGRRSVAGVGIRQRRPCGALPQSTVPIRAMKILQNGVLEVPLNYYRILRARKVNSTEVVRRNYEAQLANPPRVGYSGDALDARASLLEAAAECMLNYERRLDYDRRLAGGVIVESVPASQVAGALCLLQECGDVEQVIRIGSEWLRRRPRSPACKDVALAVALAYCDLSGEAIAAGGSVAGCCDDLEAALELLIEFQAARGLQVEIARTLKELGPQYILECLALPDGKEFEKRKAKGMAVLKSLAWEAESDGRLSPYLRPRREFLERARYYMSAGQQIELYEACPRGVRVPLDELYDLALAFVAEGYYTKRPQHIVEAEEVFQKISLANTEGLDVSVEMGLCALLLGDYDKALDCLGLVAGSPVAPDRKVLEFVKANSVDGTDLLPGVCALAEMWLKDTIIPSYREMNTDKSSLGEWFKSPRVAVYLRVLERGKDINLVSAAAAITRMSGSVARGITNAVGSAVHGMAGLLRGPAIRDPSKDPLPYGQFNLSNVPLPRTTGGEQNVKDYGSNGNVQEESNGAQADMTGEPSMNLDWEEGRENGMETTLADVQQTSSNGAEEGYWSAGDGYEPERQMEAYLQGNERQAAWMKTVLVGGVVLTAAVLGSLAVRAAIPTIQGLAASTSAGVRKTSRSMLGVISANKKGAIDVPNAEELVLRWHAIKSDAMGAEHQIAKLGEVLEGNLLKQWSENASRVQKKGWYWQYKLKGLTVDKVGISRDGRHATVEATIKESVQLMDQGRVADKHDTSYSVQYELVMKNNVWKINGSRVVFDAS